VNSIPTAERLCGKLRSTLDAYPEEDRDDEHDTRGLALKLLLMSTCMRNNVFVVEWERKKLASRPQDPSSSVGLVCSSPARRINKLTVFSCYYFSDSIPLGIRIPLL
jgi:hypothetical protein